MDRRVTAEKVIVWILVGVAAVGLLILLSPFLIGTLAVIGGFAVVLAPFLIPIGIALFLGYFLGKRGNG